MKYDFETLVSRKGTGASKWELMYSQKPDASDSAVPFSVADMEFKNAPEIINGLKKYLDSAILGYTSPTDAYYDAVIAWHEKHHGFTPEKAHILTSPGVVPAFINSVGALTEKGDSIVFMTPSYPPFWQAGKKNSVNVVECPLIADGDSYRIDFDLFENIVSRPDVKAFILCNPHNPVGRVWTKDELTRLCELCLANGVYIISDEIHSDIVRRGVKHTSVGSLDEKFAPISLVCTAPTKTFNIAGMQTSNVIAKDDALREKLVSGGVNVGLSALGYEACRLAYTYGEEWLDELTTVLDGNFELMHDYITKNLPELKMYRSEGTYLAWVDCRALGLGKDELEKLNIENELFLDEGYMFGKEGEGFERINVACPRHVLASALEKMKEAYKKAR